MKTQSLPSWRLLAGRLAACAVLAAVALLPAGAGAQTPETSTNAPTPIAFERAVLQAANEVFTKASQEGAPERIELAIDPLIDSDTGAQSNATRLEARLIADLVRRSYRRFTIVPFTTTSVSKSPYLLIGTLTHLNNAGTAGGRKDAYRVWLTLMDLKSNRIVAKSQARALPTGVDPLPTAFFADSPDVRQRPRDRGLHSDLPSHQGRRFHSRCIRAESARGGADEQCGGGLRWTPLPDRPRPLRGGASHARRRAVACSQRSLSRQPQAQQARCRGGGVRRRGRLRPAARAAGGQVPVPPGLDAVRAPTGASAASIRCGCKADRQAHGQGEPMPRDRRAHEPDRARSPSTISFPGCAPRPSASAWREKRPSSARELAARGVGFRENIVGTGRDDASDALDRRVEFTVIGCGSLPQARHVTHAVSPSARRMGCGLRRNDVIPAQAGDPATCPPGAQKRALRRRQGRRARPRRQRHRSAYPGRGVRA